MMSDDDGVALLLRQKHFKTNITIQNSLNMVRNDDNEV
jgi:hypothetical protein